MIDKGRCMFSFTEGLEQFYELWEMSNDDGEGGLNSDDAADTDAIDDDFTNKVAQPEHNFHPDSEHELRLLSGGILGHRSMSRCYSQNLRSYSTPAERAARRSIAAGTSEGETPPQLPSDRQLGTANRGEMGIVGVGEFEKRALRVTEKKALKQETRARMSHEWNVIKEMNHQKHYRVNS